MTGSLNIKPRLRPLVFLCLMLFCIRFEPAHAVNLQVQMLQSQYLSETQNVDQTSSYSSLGFQLRHFSSQEHQFHFGLDLLGMASMDGTEQGYYAAPEFFLGFHSDQASPGVGFYVGRMKRVWSEFDDEWRLGIWQPYIRWDYLHPRAQGLTGGFLTLASQDAQVVLFATPVFLPDQGPEFTVDKGQFHSSNRWFRQPTSRHTVIDQDRTLNYDLARPKEADIVSNGGYGLSVIIAPESYGPWFRTSVANKPINQLHLAIEGYHSIARTNRYLESTAVVHPTVARHTVTTVEAGMTEADSKGWISITEEHPSAAHIPSDWEESSLRATSYFGGSYTHRLPWQGYRNQWLKYSYMKVREQVPQSGAGQSDRLESSLDRFPFSEVAAVEWSALLQSSLRRRLDIGIRYLYSFPDRGALFSAKIEWLWNERTRWDLGVDVLGAESDPTSADAGLMSLYRNNDRMVGGLTYVF